MVPPTITSRSKSYPWLPQWSPTGSHLVYCQHKANAAENVFRVEASGANQTALTKYTQGYARPVAWRAD